MTVPRDPGALRLLWTSDDVAIVDKPAGMPTEPDQAGRASARDMVARALVSSGARGVVPHAVSRLDLPVSGALTFALSDRAKRALAPDGEARLAKLYVAMLAGGLEGEHVWSAPVGGRTAETRARAMASVKSAKGTVTLALFEPVTGRTHQLRVHAGGAGCPIIGERRHGDAARVVTARGAVLAPEWLVLHAPLSVFAPLPSVFMEVWAELGGEPEAWEDVQRALDAWASTKSA